MTEAGLAVLSAMGADQSGHWSEALHPYLNTIALSITVLGVAVIAWGVVRGAVMWILMEARSFKGGPRAEDRARLRVHLGYYILLGLEFIVAADIVETFMTPDWEHVAVLGAVVLIRTVISFSLSFELRSEARAGEQNEGSTELNSR